MNAVINFFKDIALNTVSMTIAFLRLCTLTVIFFLSGVHVILFSRTEVCNLEMMGVPLRCDRNKLEEKLAFVDKLRLANEDLLEESLTLGAKDNDEFPPLLDLDDDEGDEGFGPTESED